MGFNKLKKSTLVRQEVYTNSKISDKFFKTICNRLFNKNDEDLVKKTRLDKSRKADLKRLGDSNLIDKFEKDGYISLNTFSDIFRTDIKIEYMTLYKRIFKENKGITQYLIDNDFILSYRRVNRDSGHITKRVYTVVNYEKYGDFIDCILENFLNDEQRESKIKKGLFKKKPPKKRDQRKIKD